MYQNSLFYLQQGTAYIVEQDENSIFLVNNSLAFTLRPQDLGSKTPYVPFKRKSQSQLISTSKDKSKDKVKDKDKAKAKSISKSTSKSSRQSQLQDTSSSSTSSSNLNSTLAIRKDAKLNFQSFPIKLVQFKNSHYSYPFTCTTPNFNSTEFFNSHMLLKFTRSYTTARVVRVTKGGFLCLICGVLGFLPRSHAPVFLQFFNKDSSASLSAQGAKGAKGAKISKGAQGAKGAKGAKISKGANNLKTIQSTNRINRANRLKNIQTISSFKSIKGTEVSRKQKIRTLKSSILKKSKSYHLRVFKTLYSFSDLCERNFYLTIPCKLLSRFVYPPKTSRGKFQFTFIFTSFPDDFLRSERLKARLAQKKNKSNNENQIKDNTKIISIPSTKHFKGGINNSFLSSSSSYKDKVKAKDKDKASSSSSSSYIKNKFESKGGKGAEGKQQKRFITESKLPNK